MGKPVVLRLSGPADLVGAVPQLVGFMPTESLVGILTAKGRLVVTMRSDLADGAQLAAEAVVRAAVHTDADAVHVIGYGADVAGEVAALARLLCPAMQVEEVLVVSAEGRWRHAEGCACCPPEGHPSRSDSPAALGIRMITGNEPAASRAAFEARLDQTPRAARLAALPDPSEPDTQAGLLAAVAAVLLGADPVTELADELLARAARAVSTDPMGDAVLCCLCPQMLPLSEFGALGAAVAEALPVQWSLDNRRPAERGRDRFVHLCAAPAEPASRLAALTQRLLAEAVPPPR